MASEKKSDHSSDIYKSQEDLKKRKKPSTGKYKDVEAEMEDYEPVLEASEKSEATVVIDAARLPRQPAQGEMDYIRQQEGDEEFYMRPVTPRQGGDSI